MNKLVKNIVNGRSSNGIYDQRDPNENEVKKIAIDNERILNNDYNGSDKENIPIKRSTPLVPIPPRIAQRFRPSDLSELEGIK